MNRISRSVVSSCVMMLLVVSIAVLVLGAPRVGTARMASSSSPSSPTSAATSARPSMRSNTQQAAQSPPIASPSTSGRRDREEDYYDDHDDHYDDHDDHDDDDDETEEEFSEENLAGSFAFKASGFVAVGGAGSATGGTNTITGTVDASGRPPKDPATVPQNLWIAMEGRTCSDRNGRCAINAWVNINGYESFHIDTANPSSTTPPGQQCELTVDQYGQGTIYVPIDFSNDEGAATSLPPALAGAFPEFLVFRFQAFSNKSFYFEIDGCGPLATPDLVPTGASSGKNIRNACQPQSLIDAGRVPLALIGEASRIKFRCHNCKKDDFVFTGLDEEDHHCRKKKKEKEKKKEKDKKEYERERERGPRGRGNWGSDSLDA